MYASWWGEIFAGKAYEVYRQPWVSRLTGLDERGKFRREFMRGLRDYTYGQAHHSRGVYLYFALPPGLYEFSRFVSWKREERFFGRVRDDGEIERIAREEAATCLNAILA